MSVQTTMAKYFISALMFAQLERDNKLGEIPKIKWENPLNCRRFCQLVVSQCNVYSPVTTGPGGSKHFLDRTLPTVEGQRPKQVESNTHVERTDRPGRSWSGRVRSLDDGGRRLTRSRARASIPNTVGSD
jgi:hypothetical protein